MFLNNVSFAPDTNSLLLTAKEKLSMKEHECLLVHISYCETTVTLM